MQKIYKIVRMNKVALGNSNLKIYFPEEVKLD